MSGYATPTRPTQHIGSWVVLGALCRNTTKPNPNKKARMLMKYKRLLIPGASYFFTVVTHNRRAIFNHEKSIDTLRQAFRKVRVKHPFKIDAVVILPDHIHCIWTLPDGNTDYATRWRLIKTGLSKHCDPALRVMPDALRRSRKEQAIWQHRYWEHVIRDEGDLANHIAYVHYNPVKHGLVRSVYDWPYSSFHRYVAKGWLDADWGSDVVDIEGVGSE
jgi:REP-associated tyrosine transposase